jgi:hypothetical protein
LSERKSSQSVSDSSETSDTSLDITDS